jgi:adenylate cyclase
MLSSSVCYLGCTDRRSTVTTNPADERDETSGSPAAPVSVLFVDISGSTLMYAVRGDTAAFALTSACLSLLEEQVCRFGGRVIKRIGDAILAVFNEAEQAVHSAIGMHHALGDPGCALHGEGVHVRVGIASGTAVQDGGDVYGDVVNVAARLVSLAGADEIFLSGDTHDALPLEMREAVRLIDQLSLRGRPDWVLVYEYLWRRDDATVSAGDRTTRGCRAALEVTFGSQVFALGTDRVKLTIGRDGDNDITIAEDVVSRHHADVVVRGDKFLLVDRSTNGTYVLTDGGDTFRVTREEVTLAGAGRIVPGRKTLECFVRYHVRSR